MEVIDALLFEITEESQISDARRNIAKFARLSGLSDKKTDQLSITCTEFGTNLLKHTKSGGRLIVQSLTQSDTVGVELYAVDSGRGMNIDECVKDGVSTAGSFGTGLGAIKRLSDEANFFSMLDVGTVIQTRTWNSPSPAATADFDFGAFTVPKRGEELSGDKWAIERTDKHLYCMVVDGLGHGVEASDAAKLARKRFLENLDAPPAEVIKIMHMSLRGSRGAVGAVARIDFNKGIVDYCGLGNIAGVVFASGQRKHLISMNGTLGYEGRKINQLSIPWTPNSVLVMHSDGLDSKTFQSLDDVAEKPAQIIAGWLYMLHAKSVDDETVLAIKQSRSK